MASEGRIHRPRRLPIPGEVLVALGQNVGAETAVARALLPGRALAVPFAGLIGCEPAEAGRFLAVREGQDVAEGEVLARAPGVFGLGSREARAPVTGTVERISSASGQLTLRGLPQPLDVLAHIPGTVSAVFPGEGAEITCRAICVQGIYGVGGEARGRLAEAPGPGVVWVLPTATAADLRRAAETGCAALITGSVPYAELRETGLVAIVMEGFGALPMAAPTQDLLRRHLGAPASVDGTTRIRAGVVRPEVVIPVGGGSAVDNRNGAPAALRPGARVRVVRAPAFGRYGEILQLPPLPRPVPSGAVVRVAVVALDGGGVVTVPRANVEIVEG